MAYSEENSMNDSFFIVLVGFLPFIFLYLWLMFGKRYTYPDCGTSFSFAGGDRRGYGWRVDGFARIVALTWILPDGRLRCRGCLIGQKPGHSFLLWPSL